MGTRFWVLCQECRPGEGQLPSPHPRTPHLGLLITNQHWPRSPCAAAATTEPPPLPAVSVRRGSHTRSPLHPYIKRQKQVAVQGIDAAPCFSYTHVPVCALTPAGWPFVYVERVPLLSLKRPHRDGKTGGRYTTSCCLTGRAGTREPAPVGGGMAGGWSCSCSEDVAGLTFSFSAFLLNLFPP